VAATTTEPLERLRCRSTLMARHRGTDAVHQERPADHSGRGRRCGAKETASTATLLHRRTRLVSRRIALPLTIPLLRRIARRQLDRMPVAVAAPGVAAALVARAALRNTGYRAALLSPAEDRVAHRIEETARLLLRLLRLVGSALVLLDAGIRRLESLV